MTDTKQYALHLDGPALRAQRELLIRIAGHAHRKEPCQPALGDEELSSG